MNEQWAQAETLLEQRRMDTHQGFTNPVTQEPLTLRQYLMDVVNPFALWQQQNNTPDFEYQIMRNYRHYLSDMVLIRGFTQLDNGIRFASLEVKLHYVSAALDMLEHMADVHHNLSLRREEEKLKAKLKGASYLEYLQKREIHGGQG